MTQPATGAPAGWYQVPGGMRYWNGHAYQGELMKPESTVQQDIRVATRPRSSVKRKVLIGALIALVVWLTLVALNVIFAIVT